MDYFSPGLREASRALKRLIQRARLWRGHRQLAAAETELGLLGWQQVDFDAETQRQVEEIQNVEREQSRLINGAAERSAECRRLRSELESAERVYQEKRRQLQMEERKMRAPQEELERKLAEKRKTEPNFSRRIPELDRELREVTKALAELLRIEHHTPKMRQELTRVRERSVAIPNEKSDLRTQHLRTVSEIRGLEEAMAEQSLAAAHLEEQMRRLDVEWSAQELGMREKLKVQEREKTKIEDRIGELENSKANPYQAIGRVLSQSNVAPMNQPEALERVKGLELRAGEFRQALQESELASRKEDPQLLRISLLLWGVIVLILLLVLYAVLR